LLKYAGLIIKTEKLIITLSSFDLEGNCYSDRNRC